MTIRTSSRSSGMTLGLLFLTGIALNVSIAVDAGWTRILLRPSAVPESSAEAEDIEALRRSILFVQVRRCDGQGFSSGSAFVVAPGVLATAQHVIAESLTCQGEIRVRDHQGSEASVRVRAAASNADVALLEGADPTLPALRLEASAPHLQVNDLLTVVTIGYPLPNQGGATPDRAAISTDGNLSRFDATEGVFIVAGLNLNPGNSGGPVFVRGNGNVLGMAVAKVERADGLGIVVPADVIRQLFEQGTRPEAAP